MEAPWPWQTAWDTCWLTHLWQHVNHLWDEAVLDARLFHDELSSNGPLRDPIIQAFRRLIYTVVGLFCCHGIKQYVAKCMVMDMILVLDISPSGDGANLIQLFINALQAWTSSMYYPAWQETVMGITAKYAEITATPEKKTAILKRKNLHIDFIVSERSDSLKRRPGVLASAEHP
jgi:hypothetical protein